MIETTVFSKVKQYSFSRRLTIIQNKIIVYTQVPTFNEERYTNRLAQDIDFIREDRVQENYLSLGKVRYIVNESTKRAKSIEDVFQQILKIQQYPDQRSISISFYLNEICSSVSEKSIDPKQLMKMQRLIFQDCSTELIEETIKYFYSVEWKVDKINKIEYILFKNCYINDFKLKQIIQRFDYFYNQRFESSVGQKKQQESSKLDDELISFSNVEVLIQDCPNISSQFINYLENWTIVANTQHYGLNNYIVDFNQEKLRSLPYQHTKLALKEFKDDISKIDLIKFSTTPYFKYLSSLKLKKFQVQKPNILKDILSSKFQPRFKESDAENQYQQMMYNNQSSTISYQNVFQSRLQILSVDTTVCESFDSLPLHEEYWSGIKKLSFENRSDNNNDFHEITFSKMVSYSLLNLQILKFKHCSLSGQFFENFSKMECVSNIKFLGFEKCKIEGKAFKAFLYDSKITDNLQYINLCNTNINDDICFILYEIFSDKTSLRGIDISRCPKLTHKGIKYITLITSLKQINVENLPLAVTDTFATHLVDLLLRKQKKFFESCSEDEQILKIQGIDGEKEFFMKKVKQMQETIQELTQMLEEKSKQEKKEQTQLINLVQKNASEQNDEKKDKEKEKREEIITGEMVLEDPTKAQKLTIIQLTGIIAEAKLLKEKENAKVLEIINKKKEEVNLAFKEKKKNFLKHIKQISHYEDLPTINYINLNKNSQISSAFLDELNRYGFLDRLALLSVQETQVCGHIFNILLNKPLIATEAQKQDLKKEEEKQKEEQRQKLEEKRKEEERQIEEDKKNDQEKFLNFQQQQEINLGTNPNGIEKLIDQKPLLVEEDHSQKPSTASAAERINNTQLQNSPSKDDSEKQLLKKDDQIKDDIEAQLPQNNDKRPSLQNIQESRKSQQASNQKKKNQNENNKSGQNKVEEEIQIEQKSEPDNFYLKYLDLSGCVYLQASSFKNLFSIYFANLETLKLVGLNFYDNEFAVFLSNMNTYFANLKFLNLTSSQINRPSIQQLFRQIQVPLIELNMNLCKVDEDCIKLFNINLRSNLNRISLAQCFFYDSQHLLDLLDMMKPNVCFDYNFTLKQFNHLISQKIVYQIVKNYPPLQNQHVLDLSKAAFCDIDVTYWNHSSKQNEQRVNQNSKLEALIVDDTRIDFDVLFMILRRHNNITHISCKNTPNFKMIRKHIENKQAKKTYVQVGFEQMAQVLNDKSVEFSESSWNYFIQSKFKKKHTRFSGENITLNLQNQQQMQKQKIRSLIEQYKDFITKINFEYSKIEDGLLENISSGAKSINRLYLKGCNNITKAGIIRLCESKKMSPKFDLECILELKHLIDMEVMQSIAQSQYLKNIVYMDLSNVQVSNIDDGIMKICLSSNEVLLNIRILDISNTWTSDRGLQIIAVTQKLRKLEKIYYQSCNRITERGIAYILDSGTLERLDISHFIGQCSDKFNGKVLDNLKYSNRKAFLREFNFQDSLLLDKELTNLFYDISRIFNIKYLDLRKTPNIGDEGLKAIYQVKIDQLRVLILDFQVNYCLVELLLIQNKFQIKQRYDKLIPALPYADAIKKIEILQSQNLSNSDKAQAQKIQSIPVNENPNTKQLKDNKNQAQQIVQKEKIEHENLVVYTKSSLLQYAPFQITPLSNPIQEFEERRKKMKNLYNFDKIQPQNATDMNVISAFKQDNFFVDIFLNSSNLPNFRYDYFLYKHKELLDDNIIYSIALARFCLYHKKNVITRQDNRAAPKQNTNKDQVENTNLKTVFKDFRLLRYLDLSQGVKISNKAFCIFFQNFELLNFVEHINLSNTQIDEDVILSIAANQNILALKTLLIDNCSKLKDMSTAFIYLVLASKKNQMILKNQQNNAFNYNKQIEQVNQAVNATAVVNKQNNQKPTVINNNAAANNNNNNQQKNKDKEDKNKEDTFLTFDYYGFFSYYCSQLNIAAINLFLKIHSIKQKQDEKLVNQKYSQQQQKSRHIYCLNLEGCHLKGIQQIQVPKEVIIINLAQTNVDYPDLKLFLPQTKYLWIDQTYNLRDEVFNSQIQPMLEMAQPRFSYTEFLYSKSYALNKGTKMLINVLEKHDIKYIELNMFRQISHKDLESLLTNEKICNKLRSIKLDFRQLQHSKTFIRMIDLIYSLCGLDQLFVLQIDRITIQNQYKLTTSMRLSQDLILREKIKQKLSIDENVVKGYPFIDHPFKQFDQYKSDQEKPLVQTFIDAIMTPFQLNELRIGGMNITRIQVIHLLSILSKGNQLKRLFLDELPFVNDDFIISNFIKIGKSDKKKPNEQKAQQDLLKDKQEWDNRPFRYLQVLSLAQTRVTERSFISILKQLPFSINFKIGLLMESLCKDRDFTFTNYSLEALSESKYLLNITNLDTSNFDYVSHVICKVFDSKYAVNIENISLNYKLINEQVFIKLASTKMLPNLVKIDLKNSSKCYQFFHYLIRAKYINIKFEIKDIVDEPGIISSTPFLLGIIDSTYMQQIQVLNIDNIDHDINQLEQIFQVSNYLFNLKNLSINCQRDSTSNLAFWTSLAESNKIPQLEELSVKKLITSNLKVMIQQKFKPRVQIDKLLYDNQEALDDECFVILSEQPHLINIIEIDLSKLNVSKREISSTTLLKLFLSKYSFNIQKIILGEDKLSDRSKIGIEQDLVALEYVSEYLREQKKLVNEAEYKLIDTQMYKMQNKNSKDNKDKKENKEEKDGKENELKKEGLYEKFLMFNNLKNLKEIQFLSKDLLNKRYLELISRKSHYKLYSTQFDFGIFLYQLSDLYDQMQGDQEEHYELVMKEIDLHGWFEKRQKVLYIDYFIPFTTNMYDAVQQVLIRVEDFSCIEEIRYQCRPNSTTLRYFEYGDSYDVKLAFLNLQRVTINFQICKKLEFDNSYQYQHWNFFKRPFMEYGIFDFSSFYETMFSNFNVDNQRESIKRMFEVICANCPQFIEQIQDMIFYTDPCLENGLILKNLFTIPTQLKWKTISIRARGKDRDESQITLAEKDIQNQIIKSIIEFGHAKINNIESFETVSKITFEQYYDLEIKNIFSKKFNRQQFIENRVELTSHIRINQIVEIRKNSQYYYYQHAFFVPSIKLEEKKKKQKVDVQAQNTNAAPSTPANNQQKPAQNEKGAQNSQIKANQQQQQKKQEQQQHQEQIQQQQQQHQEQQAQDANNHPQSYLQQFQLHRMTKLTKLVIKAHLEWVDFVYLYDKVMPNNPGLQVTFQSTNHRPMIEYLKNTSKEKDGKDWTQEFKYLQLLFTDDKEKKKEQIIQAVVANDSAKYYLQRLDQSDKNQNAQPFTVYLFNVFKALRTGQNDLKQIGNTAQNQTKQSFNAPNSNNQKQNNNAVNNKNNTQQNQQSTNAVQVQHDQPNKEHPTSAKKNFFKFEFYISEIQFIENIEYQKEQEFFKSFPCLLEVTFQKQSINRKLPDKSVENTLSLLEFCRNPITILNVFNLLSSSLQQKHLKQMKNLKEFVKNNIFFISFRYNTFIQIKGIEERRITNLEDNQANEGKDQDQLNKEVSEGDKNINEIQLNDDNVNLQDFQSNDDSGGMSEKLSEKESILIKRKEEDFEDYEQEILKNPINQQNEQEEKQEEKVEEEKDKDEDNKLKDQEEKGKNKNRIYINEMDLNKFLKVFNNLQEIDFSYSSISKEHFQTFFDNLRNNIFDSVVMEGCEVADPEGYLLSVLKFLEENSGKGMKGMQKQQDSDKKKQFI